MDNPIPLLEQRIPEFLQNDEAFFHWGDNGPFQSFVIAFKKERTGIVMMSNSQNALKLWQEILAIVTGRAQAAVSWLYNLYEQI